MPEELKIFGEVGVVTTKDKIQAKLANRGTPCIFVGYAENHSKDVYRMLNLETNAIINSRDIIWLKKMHTDWLQNKLMTIVDEEEDGLIIIQLKLVAVLFQEHGLSKSQLNSNIDG